MSTLNFKIHKYKIDYSYLNRLKNYIDGKGVKAQRKVIEIFQKISSKKSGCTCKNMNNTSSPKISRKSLLDLLKRNELFMYVKSGILIEAYASVFFFQKNTKASVRIRTLVCEKKT